MWGGKGGGGDVQKCENTSVEDDNTSKIRETTEREDAQSATDTIPVLAGVWVMQPVIIFGPSTSIEQPGVCGQEELCGRKSAEPPHTAVRL